MTKVTISEDCENAPKKEFIKDFNIAFAKEDIDYILDCFADDAHWEMVGAQSWDGKEEIASVAYCDIYTFTGHAKDAKIKTLKAYAIDIKQEV
jgi:ketosteroid isomerase-like protein